MENFFNPKAIALVGASANESRGGNYLLKNILHGFKGSVYPVNPFHPILEGLPCYPEVKVIPEHVDLAIIFVPAITVPKVVEDCATKGIKRIIIESGGFAESGQEGQNLQNSLKEIRRRTGVRIWGPNCMGLIDPVRGNIFSFLNPIIIEKGLKVGPISLIVQSGMLTATFLLDIFSNSGTGISKACSIGNKVDVDESDILEYLLNDPSTEGIALYLESFKDGRRFVEICRNSSKPIVVLKGGKSTQGAQAARSHTASLAGNDRIASDILKEAGVVEAADFQQMIDICRTLIMVPAVKAENPARVAVITISGGSGIISTDLMEGKNLELAHLAESTKIGLKQYFPTWMSVSNPIDLWPAMEIHGISAMYCNSVAEVTGDPNVDAIFIHAAAVDNNWIDLTEISRSNSSAKPLFICLVGDREDVFKFQIKGQAARIPVFREISRALECMSAVFRRKTPVSNSKPDKIEDLPVKLQQTLNESKGILDEYDSKRILKAYGIPTVSEEVVSDKKGVERACMRFGFPLVMKGLIPDVIHKTEHDLVRFNILNKSGAVKVLNELRLKMEGKGRILIQKQVGGNLELILGLLRDRSFGPCVMCGIGGTYAEVFNDIVFASVPLSLSGALKAISLIGNQPILDSFRGMPPVDRYSLAEIMVRLGQIGMDFPNVQQIDINPVLVNLNGLVAVDATFILD